MICWVMSGSGRLHVLLRLRSCMSCVGRHGSTQLMDQPTTGHVSPPGQDLLPLISCSLNILFIRFYLLPLYLYRHTPSLWFRRNNVILPLSVEWGTHQTQLQTTWAFAVLQTSRPKNRARAKEKLSCEELTDKSEIMSAVIHFNNASLLWRPDVMETHSI